MDLEKTKQSLYECIQNIIFHQKITDKTEEEIVPSKEELSKLIHVSDNVKRKESLVLSKVN